MQIIIFSFVTLLTQAAVVLNFDLITSGKCVNTITTKKDCDAAAWNFEEITDKKSKDDGQTKKHYDPEGCYFEKGELKFNDRANTGDCSTKDKCLCFQPDYWSTAAIVAKEDACGRPINADNEFENVFVKNRQVVFSKDENSITKKCEYFSKPESLDQWPIYPFFGDRFMFNCDKTPDVCKSGIYQIPQLKKLPQVCNMLSGIWGNCENRDKTPRKYSLAELRNRLQFTWSDLVMDLLNLADLDEFWPITPYVPNPYNEYNNAFIQKHRDWWNFHHLASFKQNPLYFTALANFMHPDTGGYFCPTCMEHFTNELDIKMSEEALSNVVMALWYLHNQAQWEITSGKQKPSSEVTGNDKRHLKWNFMPTDAECEQCKTPNGWDYKEVQKHLYVEYGQKSSCVDEDNSEDCKEKQHCKWNTHWEVCQHKPAKGGYAVQTDGGNCRIPIDNEDDCEEAARMLDMKDKTASRANTRGREDKNDPSGCYYEKGRLKFNEEGNVGTCLDKDICLCRATKELLWKPPQPYEAGSSSLNARLRKTNQVLLKVLETLK